MDVGGETVRVSGRPEELAERLEASGYDMPANEIGKLGWNLHLPYSATSQRPMSLKEVAT